MPNQMYEPPASAAETPEMLHKREMDEAAKYRALAAGSSAPPPPKPKSDDDITESPTYQRLLKMQRENRAGFKQIMSKKLSAVPPGQSYDEVIPVLFPGVTRPTEIQWIKDRMDELAPKKKSEGFMPSENPFMA